MKITVNKYKNHGRHFKWRNLRYQFAVTLC